MGVLSDRIDARLSDLAEEKKRVQKAANEATAAIDAKVQTLQRARLLVTDEAEATLAALVKIGVINAL